MKYAVIGVVVLFLAIPLARQMSTEDDSNELIVVKGDRFKSPALGFEMDLPKNWHQIDEKGRIKNLEKASEELKDHEIGKTIDQVKDQVVQLFQFTKYAPESATGIISTMNCIAMKFPPNLSVTNLQRAQSSERNYRNAGPMITINRPAYEMDLNGYSVGVIDATIEMYGMKADQRHFMFSSNGFGVNIVLTYLDRTDEKILMDLMNTFKKKD